MNPVQDNNFAFIKKVTVTINEAETENKSGGSIKSLVERFKKIDDTRRREKEITGDRRRLEDFGLNVADLNRKIERLEKITEKWKERGENFDFRT